MAFSRDTEPTPETRKSTTDTRRSFVAGQISYETAMSQLNDLLKDAKKRRHVADQVNVMNVMGLLASLQGKITEGLNNLRQALHLAKIINNANQIGIINMNIGEIYRRKGEQKEALKYYHQAYAAAKGLTDFSVVAGGSLINIGETLYQLGQYADAGEKLKEAIRTIESTWPPDQDQRAGALGEAYVYLGYVHLNQGNVNDALETALKADKFARASNDLQTIGLTHRLYGELFSAYPDCKPENLDITDADAHYTKAIDCFKEINFAPELGRTYLMYAESRRKRKLKEGVDEAYLEAIAIFGRLGMSIQLSAALEARARFSAEKG